MPGSQEGRGGGPERAFFWVVPPGFLFGFNVTDGYEIIPVITDGAGNNPNLQKKFLPGKN